MDPTSVIDLNKTYHETIPQFPQAHTKQAGVEKENVWHCQAKDGELLQTYFGVGNEADFLECWLEVIEPLGTSKQQTENKEIENA